VLEPLRGAARAGGHLPRGLSHGVDGAAGRQRPRVRHSQHRQVRAIFFWDRHTPRTPPYQHPSAPPCTRSHTITHPRTRSHAPDTP
jgi:hypothetical protein